MTVEMGLPHRKWDICCIGAEPVRRSVASCRRELRKKTSKLKLSVGLAASSNICRITLCAQWIISAGI